VLDVHSRYIVASQVRLKLVSVSFSGISGASVAFGGFVPGLMPLYGYDVSRPAVLVEVHFPPDDV
jgi:hypothetical protein